jgi:hypothetical protein
MTIPADVLRAATNRTLEDMYFCEGIWIGAGVLGAEVRGSGVLSPPVVGSRVRFSGSLDGEFRVVATTRLALQLAADFLATDVSEIADAEAAALIHEFANVTCGATLCAWMPDADFHFSVPSGLTGEEVLSQWPQRLCVSGMGPELAVDLVLASE